MAYLVRFDAPAAEHLALLRARDRAIILRAIEVNLVHQARAPARNRKPLRPNDLATWQLRIGRFRVYYDVAKEPECVVNIVAIATKERDRVIIGGEEIRL